MKKLLSTFLAFAMVLATFSGIVVFSASAEVAAPAQEQEGEEPFDKGYIYTQLPGIQDWTEETMALYNAQADLKNGSASPSPATLDTTHVVGNATKSLRIAAGTKSPNNWTLAFSTCGDVNDRNAASQIGNVFGEYNTPKIMNKYTGIRVAVQNEYGEEVQFAKSSWDPNSSQLLGARLVGSKQGSWDNKTYPYATLRYYYRLTQDGVTTYPNTIKYYNGYYYFYFEDFVSGWGGNFFEKYGNSNNPYGNFYFWFQTSDQTTSTSLNGGAIYISDMQLFTAPPEPTPDNLKNIVDQVNELDAYGIYYDIVSEASLLASNAASTAEQIEPVMYQLLDIITDLSTADNAARTELDNLIDMADNLGMLTSSSPYYDALVHADQVLSGGSANYITLAEQINIVRGALSTEMFGDDLTPLMTGFYKAWRYNYTPESYAAYARAVNAVWADPDNVDEDAAIAAIAPAAAALTKVRMIESDESWFADWTTEQVQEVVDLNSEKLCDSIGNGLNHDGVYNNGDFSRNTTFTAGEGAFSMTATADFRGKSIGWKNMDRSGNGPGGLSNDGYPALKFTSIKKYGGLRMKIDVTGGSAERLLIGISNCRDMSKEDYALLIKPEYVADDGYINIPFSYFVKASWAKEKFTQDNLDSVIVFIVEAYNVTNGATVTVSDVHAYSQVLVDDDKVELFTLLNEAVGLDETGRYAEAISFANTILFNDAATEEDIATGEAIMRAVISSVSWDGDGEHYYDAVSLPFFQEWTDADVDTHNSYDGRSAVTLSTESNCLVGDAFQSVSAAVINNDTSIIVTNDNAGGALIGGDPFEGFNTDFDSYDGIAIAITDKFGLSPMLPDDAQFSFTLASATEGAPTFTATYAAADINRDPNYFYVDFADMAASEAGVNDFGGIDADQQENYSIFTITLTGTNLTGYDDAFVFSDVRLFARHDILPRDELIALIDGIRQLDPDGMFANDIEDAEDIRDNIRATQDEIDEMVEWLTEIYEALVELYDDPEVNIEDGAEFDTYADGAVSATWTPEEAVATLNGEEYAAGAAITEPGEYVLVVTNGPKSVTVNFTIIVHKHDWSEWTVTLKPTCTEAGEQTRTCSKCGDVETAAIDATGHNYEAVVTKPTCTEGGYTTYTCSVCGDSYVADQTEALGHKYEAVVTKPTCTETGYTTYTCSECGDSYVADEVAPLGHNYQETDRVPATCEEAGKIVYTCSQCGDVKEMPIDPLGHKWGEWEVVKEATYEEEGLRRRVCENDPSHVEEEAIPMLETCEHEWDEGVVTVKPTCTEAGEITYTCSKCGKTKTETVEALGHKWGEWTVTKQPTLEEDGEETRTCSCCDEVETRVIPKLTAKRGDMDGDGEITVADALKALRIAAKLVVPTGQDLAIGDVDGDGEITVADALKILRVAAKLVDESEL